MSSEAPEETSDDDERFASVEEAREAIEAFRPADYAKLRLIAKSFCRTRPTGGFVEPGDLVGEAVAKTLDGTRRWNRSVSILKHLDRVMESESGHVIEKRKSQRTVPIPMEEHEQPVQPEVDEDARDNAESELDELLSLFTDDQKALDVLELKGQGLSASEIKDELGIGQTAYDTVTKRIRRRLAKHLTNGGE